MGKIAGSAEPLKKQRPGMTPEAREMQMVNYAVDLAEKQLREGTASSAVIVHYLKLGTTRAQMEAEKLKNENELLKAKTEAIQSAKNVEEIYANAIKAMQVYTGNGTEEDYE